MLSKLLETNAAPVPRMSQTGLWTLYDGLHRSVAVRSSPMPKVRGGDLEHQAETV